MAIDVYRSLESLAPVRDSWRRLAGENTCNQPEWQFGWIEHAMPPQSELCVILSRDDSRRVLAVLPLCYNKASRSLHGMGVLPDAHCAFEILENDAGAEVDAIQEIAHFLLRGERGWRSIQLQDVPLASGCMQRWYTHLVSQKFHVIRSNPRMAYRIEAHDGLESWLGQCAPSIQSHFQQCCEVHDTMRVRWVHDQHDWAEFLAVFFDLLDQMQVNAKGSDKRRLAEQAHREWIRHSGRELLERNQLQAFSLWSDNKPMLAEFGMRTKSHWIRCLSATSSSFVSGESSRGLRSDDISIAYMTRHAERFGITTIQFIPGSSSAFLAILRPVPLETWTFTHPGWVGSASATWIRCRSKWKNWLSQFTRRDLREESH